MSHMPNISEELIDLIRRRMDDKGLSQTQVEKMAGLSNGVLSHILKAERGIGLKSARAISKVLDIPPTTINRLLKLTTRDGDKDERLDLVDEIFHKLPDADRDDLLDYATLKQKQAQARAALGDLRAALDKIPPDKSDEAIKILSDFMGRFGWQSRRI